MLKIECVNHPSHTYPLFVHSLKNFIQLPLSWLIYYRKMRRNSFPFGINLWMVVTQIEKIKKAFSHSKLLPIYWKIFKTRYLVKILFCK